MKDDIISSIKKYGGRVTKNKKMLIDLFEKEDMLTIERIAETMTGMMNLSTIYRNLNKFIELNYIEKVNLDQETYYTKKRTGKDHKHYLVCKKCHKKIEIDYCPFEKMNLKFENFNIISHKFELIGVCDECKKKK